MEHNVPSSTMGIIGGHGHFKIIKAKEVVVNAGKDVRAEVIKRNVVGEIEPIQAVLITKPSKERGQAMSR